MVKAVAGLAAELRADLLSAKTVPAVSAGLTSGLGLLVAQIAFGSLIYSGALAPWSSQGVGLVLFGNFAACLIFALAGGYRGTIAGLSPALVIVMATVGASMDAEGEARFVTAAVALMISAAATGVGFFLLGRFRLANLVRFIPYPVTAGFVAGIGASVCLGGLTLMGADVRSIPALLEPAVLQRWGPGAAYGIALYLAIKRWGNPLILPVSVVLAVGAYHVVLAATGVSGDEARAAGLLLTSTAEAGLWPVLGPADLAHVAWADLAAQIPHLLTLILIAFICVIMNVSGLELAANQELDWDREFRVTGVASVVAGLGGGTVATIVVPASLRSKLLGASTRLTGVVAAGVVGAALLLGDGILEIVPARLVGGILIFAGLGMLDEGLAKSRKRLPWSEYGIILLIMMVITAFGLIEGVAVGMLATLVFFAVRLSRVDPIQARFTARDRASNKARPVPDRAILTEEGERVHAYRLRGYLFFGSVFSLADHLRQSLRDAQRPLCLLLDFDRFRFRLLGGERPGPVPADGERGRRAGRPERRVREAAGRARAQPPSRRIRRVDGRAQRGPRPGALRGPGDRGVEGGPEPGGRAARLAAGACRRRPGALPGAPDPLRGPAGTTARPADSQGVRNRRRHRGTGSAARGPATAAVGPGLRLRRRRFAPLSVRTGGRDLAG